MYHDKRKEPPNLTLYLFRLTKIVVSVLTLRIVIISVVTTFIYCIFSKSIAELLLIVVALFTSNNWKCQPSMFHTWSLLLLLSICQCEIAGRGRRHAICNKSRAFVALYPIEMRNKTAECGVMLSAWPFLKACSKECEFCLIQNIIEWNIVAAQWQTVHKRSASTFLTSTSKVFNYWISKHSAAASFVFSGMMIVWLWLIWRCLWRLWGKEGTGDSPNDSFDTLFSTPTLVFRHDLKGGCNSRPNSSNSRELHGW